MATNHSTAGKKNERGLNHIIWSLKRHCHPTPAVPENQKTLDQGVEQSRSPAWGEFSSCQPESFLAAPRWPELLPTHAFLANEESSIWKQDTAVEVEIDLPNNRTASEKAISSLGTYFNTALKRKAVEVSERRLTPEEKIAFQGAKQIEVNNFIAAKAFGALPQGYKASKSDAVKMCWILTWKALPDGGRKPKARAVLLGYMDPWYSGRATTSPTTTRQTRQIQLAIAAAMGFQTWKGDVTGANSSVTGLSQQAVVYPMP